MAIKPFVIQRRMMELGRIRLGEKGPKGEPKKLTTLRFTSASRALLEAIAVKHGGTVRPWEGAPDEGYFEVTTNTSQVDVILPPVFSDQDGSPTAPYSQFFESWSGGGCQRRCDGETELLSGKPCMCLPQVVEKGEDARTCKITTRVSVMMPDVPGIGVWRLESHGYNAAVELPGTLEVLLLAAAERKFIPAVLRVEQRTKKVPGEGTRRFIVPVIELPEVTVRQLASGDVPLAINPPAGKTNGKPELPAGAELPADAAFEQEQTPSFGAPPPLPAALGIDAEDQPGSTEPYPQNDDAKSAPRRDAPTKPMLDKLNVLVGKLRPDHITTQGLYDGFGKTPVPGEDGEIHWAPLRDSLTRKQASDLIDYLSALEEKAGAVA